MLIGKKIRLRPKQQEDALNDYTWRKDPELARLDATTPLTTSFEEYAAGYTWELCYSSCDQHYFAIEASGNGKHIGNCLYFGVDKIKKEAELGIMIGNRDYWDKGYGTDAVLTLVNYIFDRIKMERIYLKTLEWNIRAQKCFAKCGFVPCGRLFRDGYSFVIMEIRRESFTYLPRH